MAQCEQKLIHFRAEAEECFVDLASALTAANRVQYHQVASSGNPNCYTIRVTAVKGDFILWHLQNQFATCRAVKQTCAGWKAQLRHAGIKRTDLPPYGKRARFALQSGSYVPDVAAIPGETIVTLSKLHLPPLMFTAGDPFFGIYTATDDMSIRYEAANALAAGTLSANHITQVTITDGAGAETNVPLVMVGKGVAGEFNVIAEYMKARRQTPDVSIDTPGPSSDSEMLNLFSVSEEMSDDIVEGVEDYMDWKPYTTDTAPNANFDHLIEGGQISSITSATSQYPPNSVIVDVPLGLLRIESGADLDFVIEVLAIYEM